MNTHFHLQNFDLISSYTEYEFFDISSLIFQEPGRSPIIPIVTAVVLAVSLAIAVIVSTSLVQRYCCHTYHKPDIFS